MDVFTAAAQAASPVIRRETGRLREQNDLELKNNAARFSTDLQNYIRDNPYTGDYQAFKNKLDGRISEWYDLNTKSNTSPYYQKQIQHMKTQSLEAARDFALVQEDQWRVQTEHLGRREEIRRYVETLDAEHALQASDTRMRLSKGEVYIDPNMEAAETLEYRRAVYLKHVSAALDRVQDVSQLKQALDDEDQRITALLPPQRTVVYGDDGQVIDAGEERAWSFEGQEEAKRLLLEEAKARIQRGAMERARTDDSAYRRLMDEYRQTGNGARRIEAERIAKPYWEGPIRRIVEGKAGELENYADKDKDALASLFPRYWDKPEELSAGGGKSAADRAVTDRELDELAGDVQQWLVYRAAASRGGAGVNAVGQKMAEGMPVTAAYTALEAAGGGDPDYTQSLIRRFDERLFNFISKQTNMPEVHELFALMDGLDDEKELSNIAGATGAEAGLIKRRYFNGGMEILAEYSAALAEAGGDAGREQAAREMMKTRFTALNKTYTGKAIERLIDDNGKSRYAVGFEGSGERDLAEKLGLVEDGQAEGLIFERDRRGVMNAEWGWSEKTFDAMAGRQEQLLNGFPGLRGKITRRGAFAVAEVDGKEYRMGKGPDGSLQLKELRNGEWVPLAERIAKPVGNYAVGTFWAETDDNGRVKKRSGREAAKYQDELIAASNDPLLREKLAEPSAMYEYYPFTGLGMRDPVKRFALGGGGVTGGGMARDWTER
jgi:hypothetical protein